MGSEIGFCQSVKFILDWDGDQNIFVQHFVAFRYYYRFKIFGTKIKGMNIKKPQSTETMEVCNRCHLEDIDKNFNFENPCDCTATLHLTCNKIKMNAGNADFCAYCTEILSSDELKQRKEYFDISGDFEVEKVIDYDIELNTYWVK